MINRGRTSAFVNIPILSDQKNEVQDHENHQSRRQRGLFVDCNF